MSKGTGEATGGGASVSDAVDGRRSAPDNGWRAGENEMKEILPFGGFILYNELRPLCDFPRG